MDKVRTAVIGTGHFGRFHADKYAKSSLSQFVGPDDRRDRKSAFCEITK